MIIGKILLIAAISGFIGYMTNVFAIKALFRPYVPFRLGPIAFQGLIPKRKDELAEKVAEIVGQEFLSQDDLMDRLISREDEKYFTEFIANRINQVVIEKTSFLPSAFQYKLVGAVNTQIEQESPRLFEDFKSMAENQIQEKVDVSAIIQEKIQALDLAQMEELVLRVSHKELKAIEWLGLIMGAAIGLIQGIITVYVL